MKLSKGELKQIIKEEIQTFMETSEASVVTPEKAQEILSDLEQIARRHSVDLMQLANVISLGSERITEDDGGSPPKGWFHDCTSGVKQNRDTCSAQWDKNVSPSEKARAKRNDRQ